MAPEHLCSKLWNLIAPPVLERRWTSVQFRPSMLSTVDFGGLPVEILERIFLELHYFDICSVKLVSGIYVFVVPNDPDRTHS